jgi:flagellar biogenesis protein FliO
MRLPRKTAPPAPNIGGAGGKKGPLLVRFRLPHYWGRGGLLLCALCLLAALGTVKVCAAPPGPPTSAAIPNYGGRDSAPLQPGAAPNSVDGGPAAQAGRATEALVLVLAGVVGVVYALKRFGLVQNGADGRPARIMLSALGRSRSATAQPAASVVTVESSQTLPGGAMLHVVVVPGRTLLLAATSQAVTAVAEWPDGPEGTEDTAAFEAYLARADAPETGIAASNARLRSLLSRPQPPPKDNP